MKPTTSLFTDGEDTGVYKLRLKLNNIIKRNFLTTFFSKKVLIPYTAMYSAGLCFVLMHFWAWAGPITYLAAALCAAIPVSYFGMWLDMSWKLLHAAVVGQLLGICVSQTYNYGDPTHSPQAAYGCALFVCLVIVNKCTNYDRIGKLMACLGMIIMALDPIIDPFSSRTFNYLWHSFYTALGAFTLPFVLVGFTLLFPFPLLAYHEVQSRMSVACAHMSTCIGGLTRGFCSQKQVDMYRAVSDLLFKEIEENLDAVTLLYGFVELEERYISVPFAWTSWVWNAFRFRQIDTGSENTSFAKFLQLYITLMKALLLEARTMTESLSKIQFNNTQNQFVSHLEEPLLDTAAELNEMMALILEEINNFTLLPSRKRPHILKTRVNSLLTSDGRDSENVSLGVGFLTQRFFGNVVVTDPKFLEAQSKWEKYLRSHESFRKQSETNCPDEELGEVPAANTSSIGTSNVLLFHALFERSSRRAEDNCASLLQNYQSARGAVVWAAPPVYTVKAADHPMSSSDAFGGGNVSWNPLLSHEDSMLNACRSENIICGTNNLNPRGAFVHRLLNIKDSLVRFNEKVGLLQHCEHGNMHVIGKSVCYFIIDTCFWWKVYLGSALAELYAVGMAMLVCISHLILATRAVHPLTGDRTASDGVKPILFPEVHLQLLRSTGFGYLQPIKLAAAMTVSVILMIKLLPTSEIWHNAFWITTVIVIIRNETSASHFFQACQRLEGTVLGAVYSFTMYHILGCGATETGQCSFGTTTMTLLFWIGFCSTFRDSKTHFYAAQVAGMTPIMLFLGPAGADISGAWSRVMMNCLGKCALPSKLCCC
jgi:hypothetical protein